MSEYPFTPQDLEALKAYDTPTICNELEIVSPERRVIGFTVEPVVVLDRKLPPIVGLARTGLIRAKEPPRGPIPPREDWYDYLAAGRCRRLGSFRMRMTGRASARFRARCRRPRTPLLASRAA